MVESSLVLYDNWVVAASVGGPASVEFDFEAVWSFRKIMKKSPSGFNPDRFAWLHVHPTGFGPEASSKDVECARGLTIAFGKIGKFGIVSFKSNNLNRITCDVAWYQLEGKQLVKDETETAYPLKQHLYMLKALSCASRVTEGKDE